jgi:dipeptidyl aminopeptidase/acylaminoacyl peptidase
VIGYLPGEKAVLMTSDWKDGLSRLFQRDLGTGKVREPLPALSAFEVDGAGMSEHRDLLEVTTNEDGFGTIHVYALPGFVPVAAPPMERGVAVVASFAARTMVWQVSNARTPRTSYATTWPEGKDGAPPVTRQLTWVQDQGIDLAAFPLPELVKVTAFDGRMIPAFLYLPPGVAKGAPIPFVINYHGGPEGQNRPEFSATMQYLLARGFGILMPNVRGSTGYGRAFQMLDDYKQRWDSVRDGVDVAEWLVKNGYAVPGRIATYGGSYGGFMSVACLVEDQDRVDRGLRKERMFGACVDVVGIVNLKTFLEKTSGYRRKLREAEYGPLADSTFLAGVSSIHRVNQIQVPVFIAHGFNDPRVPVEEAMQLAIALKDRGHNPRVFIAPDEGHGFVKLDNRIYFYERVASFLTETIGR